MTVRHVDSPSVYSSSTPSISTPPGGTVIPTKISVLGGVPPLLGAMSTGSGVGVAPNSGSDGGHEVNWMPPIPRGHPSPKAGCTDVPSTSVSARADKTVNRRSSGEVRRTRPQPMVVPGLTTCPDSTVRPTSKGPASPRSLFEQANKAMTATAPRTATRPFMARVISSPTASPWCAASGRWFTVQTRLGRPPLRQEPPQPTLRSGNLGEFHLCSRGSVAATDVRPSVLVSGSDVVREDRVSALRQFHRCGA